MKTPDRKPAAEPGLNPRDALDILEIRAHETQLYLARHAEVDGAVLQYLARNGAPPVRQAVAANPAAAAAVNRLLADDAEESVRAELAVKIARLMPGLSERESDATVALTIETLNCLARDAAVRVRAILAEEIKHLDCVPAAVVQRLARDLEGIVAAPLLEYSPLLSDADLIEIIACGQVQQALEAIARRRPLSAKVCDDLVGSLDVSAIATLLVNPDASIRKRTLDRVVAEAAEINAWHLPLALRTDLSARAIRRISGFAGAELIAQLAKRQGLDDATRIFLGRQLRERLEEARPECDPHAAARAVAAARAAEQLDGMFVEDAALAGQRETVIHALAALAGAGLPNVRRILASHNAKPLVALCWRAGLSMRIAFKIQTSIMKLRGSALMPARGGVDFPLSPDEMRWHLAYFEIAV